MFLSELVVKHYDWNAHRRAEREQKTNFVRQEPRFFIDINPLEYIYDLPNKLSEEIASHNWLTDDPNSVYESTESLFDFLRKQRNLIDTLLTEVQKHVTKDTYYEENVEEDFIAQRLPPESAGFQQQVHSGRSLNSIAHPRQGAGQGVPVENLEISESALETLPTLQSHPDFAVPRVDGFAGLLTGIAARIRGENERASRSQQERAAAEVLRPNGGQAVGTPGENS